MRAVDPRPCSPAAGVAVDSERLLGVRDVVGVGEGGRGGGGGRGSASGNGSSSSRSSISHGFLGFLTVLSRLY